MFAGALRFVVKGWVATQYLQPDFHFTYPFLDWVRPLPGGWLYLVFVAQMVCALLIAAGWAYRSAAIGFFLSFTYVELIDKTAYLNHYYLVSLLAFLLIFLPLDRWGRLGRDAGPRIRRSSKKVEGTVEATVEGGAEGGAPAWIAGVLRLQIGIVYFFAGLAKLNADWLLSALPLRIWLSSKAGTPLVGVLFDQPWTAFAMSWAGAAFDLSIPFLLAWRRTRPWAYVTVIGFHAATAVLFPVGVFPWIMIVATLVFFEGEELPATPHAPSSPGVLPMGLRPLLVGFFALQLLLPLRHLAYPGPVLWTEEGFRFSWRVMVVEKTGSVLYRVTDPVSGRAWDVDPGRFLTPRQERQMAFQPDMILDFAHHLRDRVEAEGVRGPEVRVEAFVSMNGRPGSRLIDPTVDLARAERDWAPKRWVLPFREGASTASQISAGLPSP